VLLWQSYSESNASTQAHCIPMNKVFANYSMEDKIYTLITAGIVKTQLANTTLKHLFKCNAVIDKCFEIKFNKNTTCVCKDGRLVIPKSLQVHAVKWYHHYLQHPGHTHFEETMSTAMYWKGIHTTIRSVMRSCKNCQTNKRRKLSTDTFHLRPS
jgi:hypothetical protein